MADIQGTAAGETLAGTGGDDVIVGGGGTDRIEGGLGNDVLTGGDDGGDTLYGESGNDQLYGGGGADSLHGGLGDDVVHGGDGDDYIKSDETGGSDVLYGDGGDDRFEVSRYKGFGTIQAYGGDGNDYFNVDVRTGATIAVDAGDGDDWVDLWSWDAAATVTLGAGRDLLSLSTLGTFNGTSSIGATVTDFQAGPAGDVVDLADALASYAPSWNGSSSPFAAGLLSLTQSGTDAILSFGSSRVLIFKNVSAASFTAENFAGFSPTGAISAPLSVAGTDAGDILAGGSGDDTIDGGGGRDRLYGGMGADSIHGGDGVDFIDGGAGNDAIDGGAGQDTIYGGFGDDVIHGGADSDWISDNDTGTDVLWGDEGNDQLWVQRDSFRSGGSVTMYGGEGNDGLFVNTYNMDPVTADGGIGNDRLTIYTLSGSLTAILGDGADVIDLGSWTKSAANAAAIVVADFATGPAGDRLEWANFLTRNATGLASGANPFTTGHARLVQSGADVLLQFDRDGGANGFVTLITFQNSLVSAFTAFNFSGFASDGSASAPLNVSGTDAADRLFGEGGGDSILGLAGNDVIYGLAGGDSLAGGNDDDLIYGGAGDDVIDGGAGNDTLYGEHGADIVTGGAGDDYLSDTSSGSDRLAGGDGNDTINVSRSSSADSLFVDGGDGADHIYVSMSGGSLAVDAGAGDDLVTLYAAQSVTLTLGAGSDTISFYDYGFVPGAITITDFQGGEGGDRLDLDHWLADELTNFQTPLAPDPNPFATGHFKLVQSGADAVLQLSMNGGGSGYSDWITFKNTDVWSLTAYNFDGYASPFAMTSGTAADETFQGGTGNDGFDGGGGNDTFLIGYGGTDKAVGAAGDDIFFVAVTAAAASHQVAGGGGNDLLQLQGHGALAITIGASAASGTLIQASGIETIQLLAGADSSRAWGSGAAPAYTLTLKDEASAAGTIVTVDASGLAAGETLNFSTDEKDSTLHLTGGAGNDVLRGGALGDVISGGEGHDQLQGGGGNDQLDGGNGNDLFVYDADPAAPDVDTVTGGAGIDELSVSFSALASPAALTYSLTPDGAGGYDGWFASGPDHRVEFTGIELFDIEGTNVADEISGTENSDFLFGAGGDDLLRGNGGADLMTGDAGVDTLIGGAGDDLYLIEAGDALDTVIEQEGEGYDQVNTALASYTLQANFEKLVGTSGSGQTLTGNGLANSIIGLTGNDVIDGGAGADSLNGGAGNDIYYVDDAGDTVADASGTDEIRTTLAAYAIGTTVENLTGLLNSGQSLTGNTLANTIRGGSGNDQLSGGGGTDILWGGAGNDQLDGGVGNDVMRGELGDDVYTVDSASDSVIENAGEGTDQVLTALASYTLGGTIENLTGTAAVAQTLRGNALDNVVNGGAASDTIRLEDGGADKAFGNGGGDQIYFGGTLTAADTADGGAGDDTLILQGDYSSGLIFGAGTMSGFEHLQLLGRAVTRYGGSSATPNAYNITTHDANVGPIGWFAVDGGSLAANESLVFDGSADTDGRFWVVGGAGADRLTGSGGNDILDGGAGADILIGGLGDDLYSADNGDTLVEAPNGGADRVETRSATFTLAANIETLTGLLTTGQTLIGNSGANTIEGDAGGDTLDGGGGTDTLKGNGGNDILRTSAPGQVWAQGGAGTDILKIDWSAATAAIVNSFNPSFALGPDGFDIGFSDWGAYDVFANGIDSVDITTGSGNDNIKTGPGNDRISLNGGDDLLDSGGGSDVADGGAGIDGLDLDLRSATGAIVWNIGANSHSGVAGSYTNFEYFAELQTGSGNDSIVTGAGERQEFIYTYLGNDSVTVFGGRDTVFAGPGLDTLIIDYSSATEAIMTLGIVDAADGMGGTFGDSGAHKVNFSGIDRFIFTGGAGNDHIITSTGDDVMSGGEGDDQFDANGGNDSLTGGVGNDILRGGDGNDILVGGVGNDTLNGGAGVDTMTGGTGDDLYVIDSLGDVATELEGEGSDRISTSLATYVLGSTFEELAGSSAAGQTLTGNAGDNLVSGWTGDDILRLNDGGADRAVGGAGSDTIYFGATFGAGDSADGGSDYDVLLLRGSYSGLSLGANVAGIESLELMSHSDSRFGGATAGPNSYAIVSQGLSGTAGLFQVDGTKLEAGETLSFDGSAETSIAFALLGGAANDVLKGGAMGDTLDGGAGADTMTGGGGDDFYRVDNANDVVVEQAHGGADRVRTTLAAYTLGANVEGLIGGLDTGQVLTGNALDNSIVGGAGNDVLDGAGGASDYLEGNGGDDRFQISLAGNVGAYGGSGTDTLVVDYSAAGGSVTSFLDTNADGHFGGLHDDAGRSVSFGGIDKFDVTTGSFDDDLRTGDGDDRLVLGAGNDLGDAGGGNDQVEGGAGNDTLLGGAGDDRLDGGAGADSMYGGQGNDLYLADSSDQAFENAGEGVDEVRTGATTYILGANFEKLTATGYGAAPLSLRGNALDNVITTEVGGAVVYLQDGGADAAYGATNNDVFYFGAAFGAGDRVDGALGSDTVVLQGAYGPLTLTAGTMIGIQTLALLSAGDDRFGGATAGTFSYDIIVAADFSSAIPMPGLPFIDEQGALVVDASGLAVGESLHFDASAADPAATYWSVRGGAGADHLVGGAGGDDLRGGGGDDLLEGGAGNDYLDDSGGGSNVLRGGEGDDLVNFDSEGSATWSTLVVEGGDGDDWALFYAGSAGTATIDMGAGDDRVDIRHMAGGSARLTLGGGRDTLAMAAVPILDAGGGLGAITVADFQAGAGGDRFEWPADLTAIFAGWTPGINPFEAGYARLVQSGADTLLQVSPSANGTFATLLRFENLAPADFTGDNLGGWSPLPVTGGAGADQLVGTASSDFLFGEGGNDFLFLQHGGDDSAHGGDGNDVLYFGEAFTSLDRADGGEGRDAIVLQGDYALTLSETNIAGIESISLQSGANTKFGDTANNFYDFAITMADGNVLPGQQLIVNGQSLRAGEDFTFNGSAEHDGKFLVYGGHGVDHLTGGDGVDVFFFEGQRWGADNKVDGGAGRDAVVISAGDGVTHIEFAADALVNIESISVNNHFATDPSQHPSYELVLNNGNVTAGGTLIVNGSSLATSAQYVNVDGSGVHDGNLILFGGAGNDALIGGDGADTLFGAGGADNLTGGAGADVFRYDATSDSTTGAVDDISGFQAGVDKIDLSRIDADTLTAGDQAFSWIGDAAFSHVAGELRFYESGGYGWVEGDTNGDGSADFVIALTAPPALLAQGDFLL